MIDPPERAAPTTERPVQRCTGRLLSILGYYRRVLESFTVMLSLDCMSCRTSMPVNGIVPSVRCYHCGTISTLDAEFWTSKLDSECFSTALGLEQGNASSSTSLGHPSSRLIYGHRVPRCQKCKGPDLDPDSLVGMVPSGACACPQCGASIRLRVADELCRAVNPNARFVVHECAEDAAAQVVQASKTPILFACMGCGGSLTVDGTARAVICSYCSASNYLPDGLWQQLNPVPVPIVFFLVCEYQAASRQAARWQSEDARAEDAARPDLTPEQFTQLARDEEDDVRVAVAGNPATPQDLLATLVADSYYGVRAAVARNPATAPQTLLRLIDDDDSDVEQALAGNRNLPAEAVERMARSDDDDKRILAAQNPQCSVATLHRLSRDDDNGVATAAKVQLEKRRAEGVDVTDKRGLFGRLFGR